MRKLGHPRFTFPRTRAVFSAGWQRSDSSDDPTPILPGTEDESTQSAHPRFLRARFLASNAVWNLSGQGAPLVVGVVAIPLIIKQIGLDRFALLTLAWSIIGYLSLFDLGMGRALSKLVAELLARGEESALPQLVWTGIAMTGAVGMAGGLVALPIAPWLVTHALQVPGSLQNEALNSIIALALSLPLITTTSGLRGAIAVVCISARAPRTEVSYTARWCLVGLLTLVAAIGVRGFTPAIAFLLVAMGATVIVSRIHLKMLYRVVRHGSTSGAGAPASIQLPPL